MQNDVFALQKVMLTASGQMMLCPADTNTKKQVERLAFLELLTGFEPVTSSLPRTRSTY